MNDEAFKFRPCLKKTAVHENNLSITTGAVADCDMLSFLRFSEKRIRRGRVEERSSCTWGVRRVNSCGTGAGNAFEDRVGFPKLGKSAATPREITTRNCLPVLLTSPQQFSEIISPLLGFVNSQRANPGAAARSAGVIFFSRGKRAGPSFRVIPLSFPGIILFLCPEH